MMVCSLHYSSIVSLVKNTVQGPGYGEFSPDEISEMHDDPFANDPDVGEFNASMRSIEADQELIDSAIRPASQSV